MKHAVMTSMSCIVVLALLALTGCGASSPVSPAGCGVTAPCPGPKAVRGGLSFAAIEAAAGENHTCALTRAGEAYCWGSNDFGELGNGVPIEVTPQSDPRQGHPVPVAGGHRFKALTTGGVYTCALTEEGAAYCWGSNFGNKLGTETTQICRHFYNGDRPCSSTPLPVDTNLVFESISAGGSTCALTAAGHAYCWGSNTRGELGDGTTERRAVPTAVTGGLSFQALSSGFLGYTYGLTVGGGIYCWGSGLAAGPGGAHASTTPIPVMPGSVFVAFSARWNHTCALGAGGDLSCWGSNQYGGLGDGTTNDSAVPVAVAGGRMFARVSTGDNRTCAITPAAQAFCWGYNEGGELGIDPSRSVNCGTAAIPLSCALKPAPVAGGLAFAAVTFGFEHTCGLVTSGAAYCWGRNDYAQLGIG